MDNEWKNSLRERFSDYSVPEPEGLWEGIEQGMAEKSRRKLLPVWLVSGAAVAAAVALVVFLHPDKKVESPVPFDVASHNTVVSDVIPDTSVPSLPLTRPSRMPSIKSFLVRKSLSFHQLRFMALSSIRMASRLLVSQY